MIPLEEITTNPNNPRKELVEIEELAENIKEIGQATAIIVDENCVLLAGHRRLAALQRLNVKKVLCDVRTGLSPFQKSSILYSTNTTQKDFDVWASREEISRIYWNEFCEEYSFRGANDKGFSAFARSLGVSPAYVKKIIDFTGKKKVFVEELKEADIDVVTTDEVLGAEEDLIPELVDFVKKEKEKAKGLNQPNNKMRAKVRAYKRKAKLEQEDVIDSRQFNFWIEKANELSYELQDYILDKGDKPSLKKLKEALAPISKFHKRI